MGPNTSYVHTFNGAYTRSNPFRELVDMTLPSNWLIGAVEFAVESLLRTNQ